MRFVSVIVTIHLERAGDDGAEFVWWAESDALPGYSGAADHLPDLLEQVRSVTAELLPPGTGVRYEVADEEDVFEERLLGPSSPDTGPMARVRQVERADRSLLQSA